MKGNMQTETQNGQRQRPAQSRGYVLVVDDEEHNRILLRDPLEANGYEIAEAQTGMEALEKIAERVPDTILLDLMMPRMSGFEVCQRLKKDLRTASVPILIVSALSDRKERLAGIAAGANDFLTKPIDIQEAVLRVGNAVQMNHLFRQLQAEQEKSEQLLLNILPRPIAERMKAGELNIADKYEDTTVLVADLVGFTALSAHIDPEQVVYLLNEIFGAFDLLTEQHGLEKIKTIGDAYMVIGGLESSTPDPTGAILELALAMKKELAAFSSEYHGSVSLRVGICTGPVVAGVIGRKKFAYDLWGETINNACWLESRGQSGGIHVCEATFERLKDRFAFQKQRSVHIKRGCTPTTYYSLEEEVAVPA